MILDTKKLPTVEEIQSKKQKEYDRMAQMYFDRRCIELKENGATDICLRNHEFLDDEDLAAMLNIFKKAGYAFETYPNPDYLRITVYRK